MRRLTNECGTLPHSREELWRRQLSSSHLENKSLFQMFGPFRKKIKKTHLNVKSYSLLCRFFNCSDCHFGFPSISSQFQISILKTFKFSCSRLVSSCLWSSDSIFCPHWSGVRQNKLSYLVSWGQNFISTEVGGILLVFHCDLICCTWSQHSDNAPHQPTELAQTAWYPVTDYLSGHLQLRCTRSHWCLFLKQNPNSNLWLYKTTLLI